MFYLAIYSIGIYTIGHCLHRKSQYILYCHCIIENMGSGMCIGTLTPI